MHNSVGVTTMIRCPRLPVELVGAIAARAPAAIVLVTMEGVCAEWRTAVQDDSTWKKLALGRFPWLRQIMDALKPTAAQCYRELYRNQLALETQPLEDIENELTNSERLDAFVFTVEASWSNPRQSQQTLSKWLKCPAARDKLVAWPTWTGRGFEQYGKVALRLWTSPAQDFTDPPLAIQHFVDALEAYNDANEEHGPWDFGREWDHVQEQAKPLRKLHVRVLVSRLTAQGVRTLQLWAGRSDIDDLLFEGRILRFETNTLAYSQKLDLLDHPTNDYWEAPELDLDTGILSYIFRYPESDHEMSMEHVLYYLEDLLPWP